MRTPLKTRLDPYLDDLRSRKLTNRALAKILGVSEAHLSRTLQPLIERAPAPSRKAKQTLRTERKAFRENAAKTMSIKAAASASNCHPRTIKRLLDRLKATP